MFPRLNHGRPFGESVWENSAVIQKTREGTDSANALFRRFKHTAKRRIAALARQRVRQLPAPDLGGGLYQTQGL